MHVPQNADLSAQHRLVPNSQDFSCTTFGTAMSWLGVDLDTVARKYPNAMDYTDTTA